VPFHASWAFADGPGCLFETYGAELQFVQQQDYRTVWTLVDGDDGHQYIVSGFHIVNRLGYLISTVPVTSDADIQVRLESSNDAADAKPSRPNAKPPDAPLRPTPLVIPTGTPLIAGKLYLRLYHGRNDPDQEMHDWGFPGPTFGPLSCYVHTYCCTFRIYAQ